MQRTLQSEILDSLSPDDPAAVRNRRDLRVINRIMGNPRWFMRILPKTLRPGERILEIGAGTGELGMRLSSRGIEVDGLDLWPRPALWPAPRAWHQSDLRRFDGYGAYPVVIANLILHQFTDGELADLGRILRRTARVLVACEPARGRLWQVLCGAAAPLFGANYVTRHDARVSIAAGFRGDELPRRMEMDAKAWDVRCSASFLGGYRMIAVRRG